MKSYSTLTNKSNCIQLHRFVRLGDRADSQVFTFIVPAQLTRGFINSAQSKEFPYGGQNWQLQLCYQRPVTNPSNDTITAGANGIPKDGLCQPSQNPLNVGLSLCGGLAGMHCELEFIRFTVLNRDSVHLNNTHEEKLSSFTAERPTRWKINWIRADLLSPEHFLFDDWTWLLEVELRGSSTIYEEFLSIPRPGKDTTQMPYLESASFTYSGSDWSISLEWKKNTEFQNCPNTNGVTGIPRTKPEGFSCPLLKLHRHSKTNHWCRVRYRTTLSWGGLGESTFGPIDQLITSDNEAMTTGCEIGDPKWFLGNQSLVISPKQRIKITVEMLAAAPVSRIDLIPIAPQGGKNVARCKDPDGHDWVVLCDILGTLVRLRFFPIVEVHHHDAQEFTQQPSNKPCELRCVAWNVHLIPHEAIRGVVKALSSPYVCYMPTFRCLLRGEKNSFELTSDTKQMMVNSDEVTEVALDLPVENVCDKNAGYIRPTDNAMTIRIEWLQSQRLCYSTYNVYDDLFQTQRKQLACELKALQKENYALEKQLYMSNGPQPPPLPSGNTQPTMRASFSANLSPILHPLHAVSSPEIRNNSTVFACSAATSQSHQFSKQSSPLVTGANSPHNGKRWPPRQSPNSFNQLCLQLPKAGSEEVTEEGSAGEETGWLSAVRRHSSCLGNSLEGNGKPRRSLPSPTQTAWRQQKRSCEEYSEGYNSREESPVYHLQVATHSGGCPSSVNSNMSSPARLNSNRQEVTGLLGLSSARNGGLPRNVMPKLKFSISSDDSADPG